MHQIIVTDDEPSVLKFIMKTLKESDTDYLLRASTSSEQTLRILEKVRPDLMITDWQMPGLSGIELIRIVRERYSLQELPIIIISGVMISSVNASEGLQVLATDFLRKPIGSEELLARVSNALMMKEMYEEIKRSNAENLLLKEEQKKYFEELLAEKEKQLKQLGRSIRQKHLLLDQFRRKFEEFNSILTQEPDDISGLAFIAPEQEWASFRMELESLQPGFFDKIQRFDPTANERRIMAYIRVGLSSKEVASLMGVSMEAAKKARQRLRKKLNAEDDRELEKILTEL